MPNTGINTPAWLIIQVRHKGNEVATPTSHIKPRCHTITTHNKLAQSNRPLHNIHPTLPRPQLGQPDRLYFHTSCNVSHTSNRRPVYRYLYHFTPDHGHRRPRSQHNRMSALPASPQSTTTRTNSPRPLGQEVVGISARPRVFVGAHYEHGMIQNTLYMPKTLLCDTPGA